MVKSITAQVELGFTISHNYQSANARVVYGETHEGEDITFEGVKAEVQKKAEVLLNETIQKSVAKFRETRSKEFLGK